VYDKVVYVIMMLGQQRIYRITMPLDRKIAFIDLTAEKITVKPIPVALRRKFLGGRGINMHLLSRHYTPSLDPFSPDNPLIFGAGLLMGCLSFGSRITITAKSPESGHLGDSNMGGDFGTLPVFADKAYHCDLCRGKPQCVKVCTTQAISVR